MNTLDRYVLRALAGGIILMMGALLTLFSLAEIVRQADDVGEGAFTFVSLLQYVLFTTPARAAALAPVAGLLGTVFGLGSLASHGELVAMRGLGYSIPRISVAVLKAGVLLGVTLGLVIEFVAPPLQQRAERARTEALGDSGDGEDGRSIWFRDGGDVVRVRGLAGEREPYDIEIFQIGREGRRLESITRARRAEVGDDGDWLLFDGEVVVDPGEDDEPRRFDELLWTNTVGAVELALLLTPPESLSPSDLRAHVACARGRGQRSALYELVMWRKLVTPWDLVAMMLLGVPFVFGRLRDATLGRRAMLGAIVGVVSHFLDEIAGYLGLILELNPILTALTPPVVVLLVAVSLISDAR